MIEEVDFGCHFRRIGIIGTGLMGGSFGKAIKANLKKTFRFLGLI